MRIVIQAFVLQHTLALSFVTSSSTSKLQD